MDCRTVIYADTFWRYRTTHNSALPQHKKNQRQQNQPNLKGKRPSVHDWSEYSLWCWLLIMSMVIFLRESLSPCETESLKKGLYPITYWYNIFLIDSGRCCIVIGLRIKIHLVDWRSGVAPQHLCIFPIILLLRNWGFWPGTDVTVPKSTVTAMAIYMKDLALCYRYQQWKNFPNIQTLWNKFQVFSM